MCGICGIFKPGGKINTTDQETLIKMRDILKHRGPDDENILLMPEMAMGFRRLKIIGLDNGQQPIVNEDKTIWLVCNGEIFNYRKLKDDLCSRGHVFQTDSDVEVILHLYEEKGTDFINDLNGQFSFAIYDSLQHKLILARDHFGIAPMYYCKKDNTWLFASEIKSLLLYPGINREVDLTALDQLFSLPGIVSPRTIFKNIASVEPGHFIVIDANHMSDEQYWDIYYPEEDQIIYKNEAYYLERLGELLEQSIKLRKEADVPIGAYMSGGLDSSLVAKLANQTNPKLCRIFSMKFEDIFFNEDAYQQMMVRDLNVETASYEFSLEDVSKYLEKAIWHCETPLKESYNTTSMVLSQLVHENGIKVVLSGEGADELFAGYPSYKFDVFRGMRGDRSQNADVENINRKKLWGNEDFFYEKNYSEFEKTKRLIYSDRINENYDDVNFINHRLLNKDRLRGRHPLHIRSYIDLKVRIADHLVSDHGDRMMMANSVEGRYPFLDKELVEFVANIPPELKLNNFQEKYLLKKYSQGRLPDEIVNREKFGFSAPGSPQLLQSSQTWVRDMLSYDTIKKGGYFNPDYVEQLKKRYESRGFVLNIPYEEDILMPIISFNILKEIFNIPNL